jgi:hypothetical protein
MDQQETVVKECPFCGEPCKQWSHYQDTGGGDGRDIFNTGCQNPKCDVRPRVHVAWRHGYLRNDDISDAEAKRVSLEQWNKRPTSVAELG